MIVGMIGLILVNGLGFFWPQHARRGSHWPTARRCSASSSTREADPHARGAEHDIAYRLQLKVGNRDSSAPTSAGSTSPTITARSEPREAVYVERREYGPFIGTPVRLKDGDRELASGADAVWQALQPLIAKAADDRATHSPDRTRRDRHHQRRDRGRSGWRSARLELGAAPGETRAVAAERAAMRATRLAELNAQYAQARGAARRGASRRPPRTRVSFWPRPTARRRSCRRSTSSVPTAPTSCRVGGRASVYASRLWEFLSGEPRESNTEGGIFPAIFGTVMMVILMSMLAVPFGVLAALYLREYARQGLLVRIVRIAVNNLAGVPSIVFGVFGLGFFVYFVGGLDRQAFFRRAAADADVRHRRDSLGVADARSPDGAGRDRGGGGGAGARSPASMREASLATGRHEVPDHPARRAAGGRAGHPDRA